MALDDGNNFQSEQGVSQNRNLHNIANELFYQSNREDKSRGESKPMNQANTTGV